MSATTPNLKCFYRFAKLNSAEQALILRNVATLVDTDKDEQSISNLYFLSGFFVEERISVADGSICEIVPFKQGYKIARFMEFASEFSAN
jgi:hypothetical protein